MKNRLSDLLSNVYCVSLPTHHERRENASRELEAFGIERWAWHDGVFAGSSEVINAVLAEGVHFSPPCFRCGKEECTCENNFLTLPQIAVSLAYRHLWKRICSETANESDLFVLCEDDVAFTARAREGANFLADAIVRGALDRSLPLLVRLGWARGKEHESEDAFTLESDRVKMSNPCYLLNAAMARQLLKAHREISHTVDVFTHREESKKGGHYILSPPLAYEHSWSTGRFESAIFPRKIRVDYLRKNASWRERLRMLFQRRSGGVGPGIRKRFEVRAGLLVLDSASNAVLLAARQALPEAVDLAVLSLEGEWLLGDEDVTLTVPEWGVWYQKLAIAASLVAQIGDLNEDLIVFEKDDLLDLDWDVTMTQISGSHRLRRNAAALLQLETSSRK